MKKILAGIISITVIVILVWVFVRWTETTSIETVPKIPASPLQNAMESQAISKVLQPAAKQPVQPEKQKPQTKAEDSPKKVDILAVTTNTEAREMLVIIENQQEVYKNRLHQFELLKKKYPAVALQYAQLKADEFTLIFDDLVGRMARHRYGPRDEATIGNYNVGVASVNLVLKENLKTFDSPEEKVRYLLKDAMKKKWSRGMGGLIGPYCKDIDEGMKRDFTPGEDDMFLYSCKKHCDLSCLDAIWNRHKEDWTGPGISMKKTIYIAKCRDYKICNVDAFLQRLREPDDPEYEVYLNLIHFIVAWPWAHCIPFEDMLLKAEETGNTWFIEDLMKSEQQYREMQRNCFNQQ